MLLVAKISAPDCLRTFRAGFSSLKLKIYPACSKFSQFLAEIIREIENRERREGLEGLFGAGNDELATSVRVGTFNL